MLLIRRCLMCRNLVTLSLQCILDFGSFLPLFIAGLSWYIFWVSVKYLNAKPFGNRPESLLELDLICWLCFLTGCRWKHLLNQWLCQYQSAIMTVRFHLTTCLNSGIFHLCCATDIYNIYWTYQINLLWNYIFKLVPDFGLPFTKYLWLDTHI